MKSIKKKDLEIKLEEIPPHPDPKPDLEQYSTPAEIAADILFQATVSGDIYGRRVGDFGCGTGIFSLGAAYIGAEKVFAFDVDQGALDIAEDIADRWDLDDKVEFSCMDISQFEEDVDTVIMNPPFGSQKKGADLPFLDKAFERSQKIYSLHNVNTTDFLRKYVQDRPFRIGWEKRYMFEMDNIFEFHTKSKKEIEIILLVMEKIEG
ncbi:MAG: METTL5 family protein [Thermoplasmatota archaeon]